MRERQEARKDRERDHATKIQLGKLTCVVSRYLSCGDS